MKCIQCKKEIEKGFWCSINCKRQFFIEQYYNSSMIYDIEESIRIENEKNSEKNINDYKIFKKKNFGKSYVDFVLSLSKNEVKKEWQKRIRNVEYVVNQLQVIIVWNVIFSKGKKKKGCVGRARKKQQTRKDNRIYAN